MQITGKQSVIQIGQRVIQLIRQDCLHQYGSGLLAETHARKITQSQDQERSFKARVGIEKYRLYCKIRGPGQVKWFQHLNILKTTQSGNCMEMTILAYIIFTRIVPPGIKVEFRTVKYTHEIEHGYVSLKPLHADTDEQTLIIDPWPSNQLANPQVVHKKDHFCGQFEYKVSHTYQNKEDKPLKKLFKNFKHLQLTHFNLNELNNLEKQIKKKDNFNDPVWSLINASIPNAEFTDISKNPTLHSIFKSSRVHRKSVIKGEN